MIRPVEIRIARESVNDDSVTIVEWHFSQGQKVESGEVLLSVETSKAVMEVEAPANGYLEIVLGVGTQVAVGSLVAILQPLQIAEPKISANGSHSLETADGPGFRLSHKAALLAAERELDTSVFEGRGLIRECDVLKLLRENGGIEEIKKPADQEKEGRQKNEAPLTGESTIQPPEAEEGAEITLASTNPVGFFSDARKSARERGRSLFWLGLNYFFRNYILGHMASLAPLGLNKVVHRWRGVKMGKGVYIDPSATLETAYPENITIGDDVRVTARAVIMTHIKAPHHLRNSGIMPMVNRPVVLEDHSFIGVGAVVMPGVRVGKGAVVSSGSVVLHDVPPYSLVTGNPAKVVKRFSVQNQGNQNGKTGH